MPFRVNAKSDINLPIENRIAPSVEQWLRGFYDAEFVVTDSFHACVFSILFNKPFLVVGNQKRGLSRFVSLLGMFGLEDRLITDMNINNVLFSKVIDYMPINNLLNELKQKSIRLFNANI